MTQKQSQTLTPEQQLVVSSRAKLLAVDAFAGTGKTSTLVAYAEARPRARILYIAFNRSVANEARERFGDHVDCRTTHSLAYGAVGKRYKDKLGNPSAFDVARGFRCPTGRAKQALVALNAWLSSTDPHITSAHVDREMVEAADEVALVVDLARNLWAQMIDERSPTKLPHDGYLKLWAMSKPRLRYDIVLLDEAQDTNPLTLELVLAQTQATLVLVGDRHQGIYGFRKAMNAMEVVQADQRVALTQSFRFGNAIAQVASTLLCNLKDEMCTLRGRDDIAVQWHVDQTRHHAVLARTNAGVFGEAANAVKSGRAKRLHFVGGFDSYPFGKILDAFHLWADERSCIKDATVGRFSTYQEFAKYGADAQDAEIKMLVKIVETFRAEIPRIFDALKAAETLDERRADVTFTTAHRAKGLEWEQVRLVDDFVELPPPDDVDLEEINLLYVALTRAIRAVELTGSLTAWLQSRGQVVDQDSPEGSAAPQQDAAPDLAWANDAQRLEWLRENARFFGNVAADEVRFLLGQYDALQRELQALREQAQSRALTQEHGATAH